MNYEIALTTVISLAVAIGFVFWIIGSIKALERRLETERELRRDMDQRLYHYAGQAEEAYRALGLTREPSTPAKWVKKD